MTAMVTLWVCLGTPAGYVSARMYKMFGGEKWKSNTILTCSLVPGITFALFFCPEPAAVGRALVGRPAVWNARCPRAPVVLHLGAADLCRCVLWLQEARAGASRAEEPHSTADSATAAVHAHAAVGFHGWHPPLWLHLHPALLHPHQHLGPQAVLRVWFSLHCVSDSRHHHHRVDHPALLLPPLQ